MRKFDVNVLEKPFCRAVQILLWILFIFVFPLQQETNKSVVSTTVFFIVSSVRSCVHPGTFYSSVRVTGAAWWGQTHMCCFKVKGQFKQQQQFGKLLFWNNTGEKIQWWRMLQISAKQQTALHITCCSSAVVHSKRLNYCALFQKMKGWMDGCPTCIRCWLLSERTVAVKTPPTSNARPRPNYRVPFIQFLFISVLLEWSVSLTAVFLLRSGISGLFTFLCTD